jgi:hypothetical protein
MMSVQMGRAGLRGTRCAVMVTTLAFAASAAAPVAGSTSPSSHTKAAGAAKLKKKAKRKTKKAVRRSLPVAPIPGLSEPVSPPKIKVANCKKRVKRGRVAAFKCKWNVTGELAGRVPVRCNGRATFNARKKRVTRVQR